MNDSTEPILNYPTRPDGSLFARGQGGVPGLPKLAPSPSQPGSVHWAAVLIFGGPERFVQIIESIVAGQGQLAEAEWQRFCVLYREWQRRRKLGRLERDPTLNDVAFVMKINTEEFFGRISIAMQGLFTKVARMKALQLLPEAIDLTGEAMRDLEKGGDDRDRILELGGMVVRKGGVAVNVNNTNQLGVKVEVRNEALRGPLGQFSETIEAVDEAVRDEASARAALPPADFSNLVENDGQTERRDLERVEVLVRPGEVSSAVLLDRDGDGEMVGGGGAEKTTLDETTRE